jgi:hypothetical protein
VTPAYYPSLSVNLRLRFDEALHVVDHPLPKANTVDDLVNGAPLQVTISSGPQLRATMTSVRPLILTGTADKMSVVLNRVPLTAKIGLNGYRQAHKWSLEFDYRDFPIDPRVVRAIGVEIYLGAVKPDDFQGGIRETPATRGAPRRSLVQPRTATGFPQNLVLIGVADSIASSFADGRAVVTMEGRDQRGIFLDPPYVGPSIFGKLDYSQPIHKLVQQIIGFHPLGPDITVAVNEDDWNGPVPAVGAVGKLTRPNLGAAGAQGRMPTAGSGNQILFWDLITQYCYLVGTIPYFDYSVGGSSRLVIRPVRNLYDHKRAGIDPRIKTPFADGKQREIRTESGNEALSIRRMVYGRDIADLSFERKLQGVKPHVVEVVCSDTSSKKRGREKLLTARWPDTGVIAERDRVTKAKVTTVGPSGAAAVSDITYVPVHGVNDVAQLRDIAKSIYEEIGRGEMGGKVSTKDLASFGAGNEDTDILRLRPGDPVQLLVDARALASRPPLETELTEHNRRPFDEEVKEIEAKLGDANIARVLVACARNSVVELQSYFRVGNVNFSWDVKSGVGVDFDFQNYVEARYRVDDDKANQRQPSTVTTGTGGLVGSISAA